MYRTDTYFFAKLLVEAPIIFAEFFIGFSIVYWMAYINPDVMKYLIALGIILLTVQVTSGLGYFLSCASPNVDFALGICPLLIIPALLFGEFYLKTNSVVPWLAWIQYISWFKYGYSALVINQWSGVKEITCHQNETVPAPGVNTSLHQPCFTTGEDVLKNQDMDPVIYFMQLNFKSINLFSGLFHIESNPPCCTCCCIQSICLPFSLLEGKKKIISCAYLSQRK